MGILASSPGIHTRVLSLLTGQSWNTCLHHLRVLEAKGDVVSRKIQGKLCWFDVRRGAMESKEGTFLLRDRTNRRLAQTILVEPGRTQIQLARDMGLAASIIHRRVSAMEEVGLVERQDQNRSKLVFPTPSLETVTRATLQRQRLGGDAAVDAVPAAVDATRPDGVDPAFVATDAAAFGAVEG